MTAIFTEDEQDVLARPHVARAWFGAFDLPSGMARFHNGCGTVTIGGFDWSGVTDPVGGQLVSVGMVEEPVFGQAAALQIVIAGASLAFIQSVHSTAAEIEGRSADIYWAAFDAETQQALTGLKKLFPRGRMTSPAIQWGGLAKRLVAITVESVWATQNFPPGGKWNGPGQRARYPGDLGLDFVGVKISENWTA